MKISEFYDDFSQLQSKVGINHRHLRIQKFLEFCGLRDAKNVLEIGCGVGTQTELILGYLNLKSYVTAIDISPKSIEIAERRLNKFSNRKLLVGDILDIQPNGKFDFIILPDVIEHIPLESHKKLFFKINSLLTESGKIIINIPHPDFQEFQIKNRPDQLQIIDLPVYLYGLDKNLEMAGLIINKLQNYSVYIKPYDYQIMEVLKKSYEFAGVENPVNDSLIRRIKRKIRVRFRFF